MSPVQNWIGVMGFSPFQVDKNPLFLQFFREYLRVSLLDVLLENLPVENGAFVNMGYKIGSVQWDFLQVYLPGITYFFDLPKSAYG